MLGEGKVRSIGVSNLTVAQLEWLAKRSNVVPAVNQVELHPHYQQAELRLYHRSHGTVTEAWSPIARGRSLADPMLNMLAKKYGKSTAQLVLRWHLQLGNITLIKSATPSRIRDNLALYDFEIEAADMDKIAGLDGDPNGAPSLTIGAGLPRWNP